MPILFRQHHHFYGFGSQTKVTKTWHEDLYWVFYNIIKDQGKNEVAIKILLVYPEFPDTFGASSTL